MANVQAALAQWGLAMVDVAADGACQFNALCVSGSLDLEPLALRKQVHDFMQANPHLYTEYVEGDWQEYLASILNPSTWGDHLTLAAAAMVLNRPIAVHSTSGDGNAEPIVIPTHANYNDVLPIPLVHEAERHYQAVVPAEEAEEQGPSDPDTCHCGFLLLQGVCINPECGKRFQPQRRITGKAAMPGSAAKDDSKPELSPSQGSGARKCGTCGLHGHRAETCPERKKPIPKNGPRGSSCPDAWSPAYSHSPTGDVVKSKKGKCFRPLHKGIRYPTILAMDEDECKKEVCKKYNLLPQLVNRHCFKCGEAVAREGDILRCGSCDQRIQAERSCTPLHGTMSSWKDYACAAFCWSCQMRIDQTVLYTELSENTVRRLFAAFRDMTAWFAVKVHADKQFSCAEVDLDGAVGHINRASNPDKNIHTGRVFIMKERASKTTKLVTMDDHDVQKGSASKPESLKDVREPITSTLTDGSIGSSDGCQAIKSATLAAGTQPGEVLHQYVSHGRQPCKQFTKLELIPKDKVPDSLEQVLRQQDRWNEQSGHVRSTAGNQHAESEFGTARNLLASKCAHRGGAHRHSAAHMCSAVFLSHSPGLEALGHAIKAWFDAHIDQGDPKEYFDAKGWTGTGASANDKDTARIVAGGGKLDKPRAETRPAEAADPNLPGAQPKAKGSKKLPKAGSKPAKIAARLKVKNPKMSKKKP